MSVLDPVADAGVFVITTGRCGSTLLSDMLGRHPAVLSLSEMISGLQPGAFPAEPLTGPQFWDLLDRRRGLATTLLTHGLEPVEVRYRFGPERRYARDTPGVPPLCLTALPSLVDDPESLYDEIHAFVETRDSAPARHHYRALFAWLCVRFGRTAWVERSGGSAAWVDETIAEFPTARFIHLYRDGCDTSLSMSRHPAFRLELIRERLSQWLRVDPFESDDRSRIGRLPEPWLGVLPESFDPTNFWELDLPVEYFGMAWSITVARVLRSLERVDPAQVHHLRYERLVGDPTTEIARLAEFIPGDEGDGSWRREAAAMIHAPPPDLAGHSERLISACRVGELRLQRAQLP